MSNKNKVAIIFTGGTISMKIDPRIHAAIPALTSEEIISMVTNIENFSEIEVINYANIPSPHITPSMMMEIADLVKQTITRDDITGVIVTHGTDTLEETAYLLDLIIKTEKPIVVVGAMRNSSELGYDGSSNLSAALCTAISNKARNKGVLVVMNNEVNAASEVTKTNTLSLDTFKSPEFGPLGIVDNDEVIFYRDIISHQFIDTNIIEEKVGLIKSVPGMESDILDFYINSGYKGIVIESLGRGNLPPQMIPGIKKAISQNIPVVMVSRCPTGRVLDSYGYEGGGKHLRELGVIFGGNLPGQKIRIKLMLALGSTKDMHKIKEIIEQNLFN
ncbi:asparaginase [Tissierella praeacuta DSM 18095]|uniref:asparaginase n=1 Tax=Tissierella praeacuta DSM 18095 TaxID=1123404 RepID=A0A1M4ZJT2_9FIRM|nr:asparaginase [Tissierella praeacuta]SHF18299.1 asparaginase [Tissierella praeacuta DSM 18095]SUP00672.1 Probable L-asparaginase periplasmic precursor [Tissierella praeacuta]